MGRSQKILIDDDIELFIEMDRNFLQRDDFDLLISSGGETFLATLESHAPQMAFLGLEMPEMSGLECCRKIKQNPKTRDTVVVMVVAAGQPELAKKCRAAGCDEILFKPFKHDEFLATVRRHIPLDVRQGKRMKAQLRITYGPEPQKTLSEYSVDISAGGLYLKTDFPLDVDENLTLKFILPELQRLVSCQARVAWVNLKNNPRKAAFPPGMGIQFVDLPLEDMKSLRRFLEHNELEPSW